MERWHGDHERSYERSNFSSQEDLISKKHTCGWNRVPVDELISQGIGFLLTGPMADEQKLNEQHSINKNYYYYHFFSHFRTVVGSHFIISIIFLSYVHSRPCCLALSLFRTFAVMLFHLLLLFNYYLVWSIL